MLMAILAATVKNIAENEKMMEELGTGKIVLVHMVDAFTKLKDME